MVNIHCLFSIFFKNFSILPIISESHKIAKTQELPHYSNALNKLQIMRQNFPLKSELLSRENKAFSLTGVGEEKTFNQMCWSSETSIWPTQHLNKVSYTQIFHLNVA